LTKSVNSSISSSNERAPRAKSAFRCQGRWLLFSILGYLVVAAMLNLLVNPLRMGPARCSIAALETYRDISRDVRTGKAGLVRYHSDIEIAIVGSSRFEIGLDPLQPAFRGRRTMNLAMAAATLHENIAMIRYLLARQPHLRQLIFGLELDDLSNDADSRTFTSFYASPLAGSDNSLDREIRHLVGISDLEQSIATLARCLRRKTTTRTAFGLWLSPRIPPDPRVYLQAHSAVLAERLPIMYGIRPQPLRSDKLAKLKSVLLELRSRGVQVLIALPPKLAWEQIHPVLDAVSYAPWTAERRGLYELCKAVNATDIPAGPPVQLWDFDTFNSQTCFALPGTSSDSRVPHWFDPGHFDVTIGQAIVERMLGVIAPPANQPLAEKFGINVFDVGLEAHLTGLRDGHARFCRAHSNDVAWIRSIILPDSNLQKQKAAAFDDL
jgi:hypothetical protein